MFPWWGEYFKVNLLGKKCFCCGGRWKNWAEKNLLGNNLS
jgi:hypothetical protein